MPTSFLHSSRFRRAPARLAGRSSPAKLRLGCDLCAVAAVQSAATTFGARYLQRVFTAQELADCQTSQGWRFTSLAARFAAKEATMKVLRVRADQALPWSDIEIRRDQQGLPQLRLSGRALVLAQQAALSDWCLTLSHETDYACATVLAKSKLYSRK